MTTPKLQLSAPITRLRGGTAKGLASGSTAVDRAGGKYGAGLIKGFAVVTRGEALGHGVWLDAHFVKQTRIALNKMKRGAKSRFTHPGLSADGMGKLLGRAYRGTLEEDVLRSDLHLAKIAHRAPDGNLAEYVMGLAKEDPEAFGASIVYMPDFAAEAEFAVAHGGKQSREGGYVDLTEFRSPDPFNTKNLPHARLAALHAVDIVDDPAANPSGMFGRDPVFADAERLMLHVAGVSQETPQLQALDVEPRRVARFVTSFLDRHGLAITKKEAPPVSVSKPTATPAPAPAPEPAAPPAEKTYSAADINRFREAYGAQGVEWLLAGKTFEEAGQLHTQARLAAVEKERDELKATHATQLAAVEKERDELKHQLASAKLPGEEKPASFGAGETNPEAKPLANALGDRMGNYAASLRLKPSNN